MIIPFLFTGFMYFIFEIVLPHAEEIQRFEETCSKKGGMVYERRNQPDICIKPEIIKIP
jgi:hypothetical protein